MNLIKLVKVTKSNVGIDASLNKFKMRVIIILTFTGSVYGLEVNIIKVLIYYVPTSVIHSISCERSSFEIHNCK